MTEIKSLLEQLTWQEYSLIGAALLSLILLISYSVARNKIKKMRKDRVADQIDLQESGKKEKWFRVFSEAAPQVFWIRNAIKTVYVSPYFEDLVEHSEKLAYGKLDQLTEISHPDDVELMKADYQKLVDGSEANLDHSFRIRRSDGKHKWIRERVFHFKDISGERFLVGLLEDETKKQQYIEDLKNNQIFVNNILSSTDEGIYVLDRDFKPIYWNREMEVMSGYSAETLFDGRKIWDHFPHLIENGVSKIIQSTREGTISPPGEYHFHLPNDRKGITREKYLPLRNTKQQISGVIGFILDITEESARETILEKTQEQYALTLQAVNDGLWDWNMEKGTMIFSDQLFTMLGYIPTELSSSLKTFGNFMGSENYESFKSQALEAFEKNKSIDLEIPMQHKSGEWLWMMVRGKCIEYTPEGNPVRAIGTQTNINQRKKYELNLIEAKEKAEESDRLKSAFLSVMSHEFRTPMNAIMGFSDLIAAEDVSLEEINGYKQQIRYNSDKLCHLIEDVIDLAKLESAQYELEPEAVELVQALKEITSEIISSNPTSSLGQVALKVRIPSDLKVCHWTIDIHLLRQMLKQLLNNALKFTKKGHIAVGLLPPQNGEITIFVEDTGIGIADNDLSRIFNRFEQVDSGLTREYGGVGLGLNMVKQIVDLLGGQIRVESTLDVGTSFFISLKK